MIAVPTVLVDCIKIRAIRHWDRHHCRARSCSNPDNVRNGPPVVEHIHILGFKADKPALPCVPWYDQALFFLRTTIGQERAFQVPCMNS
jgi:hypothetical protein